MPSFGHMGRIPTDMPAAWSLDQLRYEVRASGDVDEHAGNISAWQQEYDQLSCGRFAGQVRELWIDGPRLQVFHEHTAQETSQQCMPWQGAVWFGISDARHREPLHFCGTQHSNADRTVMRARARDGFALRTPRDFGIYGVVMDEDWLHAQADALGLAPLPSLAQAAAIAPAVHTALCQTIEALLRLGSSGETGQAWGRVALNALLSHLLRLLASTGDESAALPALRASQRRFATVMAARELASRPNHEALSVDDLCARLHLTRRTLQNHFQSVVGESPADFLKAVRLNACRRHLREASTTAQTVQDVAAQWGFFHMGHFSQDYKLMFGELPSQTLRQPPTRH
ncbi:helix-turn-helix domain-containing protein [Xylophilus sp. GW821-FHT01B05]